MALVEGNMYAFTFRNGNTLEYKLISEQSHNGHAYCIMNDRFDLAWFNKWDVTNVEPVKPAVILKTYKANVNGKLHTVQAVNRVAVRAMFWGKANTIKYIKEVK